MRRFAQLLLVAALIAAASCTQPTPSHVQNENPSRLPAVDGRSELLSTQQIQAIVVATRQQLARSEPWARVYKVTVHSATKAEAFYGEPDDPRGGASFIFELRKSRWVVTGQGGWEY
jgi:hypothetical protein